ncbi:AlpA family phage regulatory protein [Acetobacter fabarum]|uniref:helix-turn-helix transcriptional regulator n=1 Tax=Acetobacter fabarum TaxID=483199 RepID=UPI001404382C|nr:AlpA family phage regulatory protein [Acetobacter fabarum]NHO42785.1 AlpA family phage regulatory protein [Acetobacter fabarum]
MSSQLSQAEPLEQFLTAKEVAKCLKVTTRTLYRRMDSGNFPRPVKFSENCVRWREQDVKSWISSLEMPQATASLTSAIR